jgi:septal ring factor EnvC (AmiA/AmiB activator)
VNASGTQRRTTIVLASLVAVLVIAAGLFVALFLIERGAVSEANDQISSTEREIAGQQDKLGDAKSSVDDLEAKGQELQTNNDKLQACADSAKKALRAAQADNDTDLTAAINEMLTNCVRGEVTTS